MHRLKTIGTSIGIAFSVLTSSLPFGSAPKNSEAKVEPHSVTSEYSSNKPASQSRMEELVEAPLEKNVYSSNSPRVIETPAVSIQSMSLSSNKTKYVDDNATRYREFKDGIYESLLSEYADYYHLDRNKVIAIARKLTKNFEIDFLEVNNTRAYKIDNLEASIMIFVDQLSRDDLIVPLKKIGFSAGGLRTKYTIDKMKPSYKLSRGESFYEFFERVANLLGVNKEYALAICFHESDELDSYIARNKNNFGGLLTTSGALTYVTPEAGIIAYLKLLKSFEHDGYKSLYEFSSMYVGGRRYGSYDSYWTGRVKAFKRQVDRNHDKYFPKKVVTGKSFMMHMGPNYKG